MQTRSNNKIIHYTILRKMFFYRGADKIKERIGEMDITDINHVIVYENALTAVQQQQMGPDGMEIDLTALNDQAPNDQVTAGDQSGLTNLHPKQGQSIFQSPKGMNKSRNMLAQKVSGFYLFQF